MEKISYQKALEKACFGALHLVLCNDLPNNEPSMFERVRSSKNVSEAEDMPEFFQFFAVNLSDNDVDFACNYFSDMCFAYSELCGFWVLCVPFFGVSWDLVNVECYL